MENILGGLNQAQKAAVTSTAPVLQVLAPPGSGKTKTLTARAAYLIAHHGLNPRNIIVCTFTNKAAREMRERVRGFLGEEIANKLILGTFHSIARRFLLTEGNRIGLDKKFSIADTADTKALLTRIIKKLKLDDSINAGAARARISTLKSRNVTSEQYSTRHKKADEQQFAQIYAEYEDQLQISKLLDFDDLILRCAELLRHHPVCVANIEAVLIDEFQDTNNVQYDLMQLFAQHREAITIVGDPDQSIYGWRNAEIENLKKMQQQYSDTHVINLEDNYRSSAAILLAAQELIEQDESRPPKRLMATHTVGFRPVLRRLPHANAEANWIVSEMKRTSALTGELLCWSDYAVLFRSSHHSRLVETALGKEGIPYRMVGGHRFFDRIEVRLLLDYLRVISHPNHNDALARILNIPARGIGATTLQHLLEEAEEDRIPLWKIIVNVAQGKKRCKTLLSKAAEQGIIKFFNIIMTAQNKLRHQSSDNSTLVDFLSNVISRIDLRTHLKGISKKDPEDFESRWANVQELIAQAAEFTSDRQDDQIINAEPVESWVIPDEVDLTPTEEALSKFLANVALSTDAVKVEEDGQPKAQVTLSTIHAAKGLEWPVVFIPAAYEGSIPHSRAEDQDEERRLLYVAMTRAQSLLYLSCPKKNSRDSVSTENSSDSSGETKLSRFLSQKPMDSYFDKRGLIMGFEVAKEIAIILRRKCPDLVAVENALQVFEHPRDNRWTLTGEAVIPEHKEWQFGANIDTLDEDGPNKRRRSGGGFQSIRQTGMHDARVPVQGFGSATTMQRAEYSVSSATLTPSFVSAARLEVNASAEPQLVSGTLPQSSTAVSTSQKRKVGSAASVEQSSLRNFFSTTAVRSGVKDAGAEPRHQAPLRDISGISNAANVTPSCRNIKNTENIMGSFEKRIGTSADYEGNVASKSRPATTFHTFSTSGAQVGLPSQRTGTRLGMLGRSHNGWSSRVHK